VSTVKVTVKAPFLAHAPIEPQAAVASVQPDKVEVWVSSQAPFGVQAAVATALKRDPESVVVYHAGEGGAFGGKVTPTVAVEATRASAALNKPVRINWTREEEFQLDQFRPAMLIDVTTGLTANGDVAGWQYDLYHASYFPPGAQRPQFTAAEQTADVTAMYPNLPNARTMNYRSHSPLPLFVWRANGRPVNALARESAIDQLAEQAGLDPIAFRDKLLKDNPRMLAVMHAVVDKARQSGYNPSPRPNGSGSGYGFALDFGNETFVAEIAQVDVDQTSGRLAVRHVDVAVDCGLVVNPLGVTTQVEGSVVQSTSAALKEQLTFAAGRVTSTMFAQYPILTISEAPSVDVVFVEDKSKPMSGIGEPAVGPVAAAISAAVYDAVGVRLFDLPFRPDKVLAALSGHS
jgi:isoquinoline 1-oxidoreductase beta subunit